MSVRLHPRTLIVQQARLEIGRAVLDVIQEHDLTLIEAIRCLQSEQDSLLRHALRAERHPQDPDKKADEA